MGKALIIGTGEAHQRIESLLNQAGFESVVIEDDCSGWPGLTSLREEDPDLLVVSYGYAPGEDMEIVSALRHLTVAPIIVTGEAEEEAVVTALIQGADAYLSCSASNETVLAYVNALLRRQPMPSPAV